MNNTGKTNTTDSTLKTKIVTKETTKIDEQLIDACKNNNLQEVRRLLTDKNLPYNANVTYKFSACFVEACKKGYIEIIDYLLTSEELEEHVNIDACKGAGLRSACEAGNLELVKYLLTNKKLKKVANININDDQTLMSACLYGHLEIVQYLLTSPELKKHSKIKAQNGLALSNACACTLIKGVSQEEIDEDINNRLKLVKFLLTSPLLKEHVNINDNDALLVASNIFHSNFTLVKYLLKNSELKHYINIDETYERDGKVYKKKKLPMTVLDVAAINNNLELVKFLLESTDLKERANLYYNSCNAIRHADEPVLSYLLEKVDFQNTNYANDTFEAICVKVEYENLSDDYINKLVYEYDIVLTEALPSIADVYKSIKNKYNLVEMINKRELTKKLEEDLKNNTTSNFIKHKV